MKDMKNIGEVYITSNKTVMFKLPNISIEVIASKLLKEIKQIKEYDCDGYVVLDTNYGEEFYDLKHVLKELDLLTLVDLQKEIKNISKFELRG